MSYPFLNPNFRFSETFVLKEIGVAVWPLRMLLDTPWLHCRGFRGVGSNGVIPFRHEFFGERPWSSLRWCMLSWFESTLQESLCWMPFYLRSDCHSTGTKGFRGPGFFSEASHPHNPSQRKSPYSRRPTPRTKTSFIPGWTFFPTNVLLPDLDDCTFFSHYGACWV